MAQPAVDHSHRGCLVKTDPALVEALISAVKEAGQDETLSKRILAWYEGLTSGNESLSDPESVLRHLELLYDSVNLGEQPSSSTTKEDR